MALDKIPVLIYPEALRPCGVLVVRGVKNYLRGHQAGSRSQHPAGAQLTKETQMASEGIIEDHKVDKQGRPAGGLTTGKGIRIKWQNGPLQAKDGSRKDPNGAFVEDVIGAAIGRIRHYQKSQFHSVENAVALGHLLAAEEVLAERTRAREDRGVEGTHEV